MKELKDGSVKVGISDYAQDKAGEFMAIGIEKLDEQITQDGNITVKDLCKGIFIS